MKFLEKKLSPNDKGESPHIVTFYAFLLMRLGNELSAGGKRFPGAVQVKRPVKLFMLQSFLIGIDLHRVLEWEIQWHMTKS